MSTYDDDNIEFDFFDEPETKEASTRRRLPGRSGGGRGDGPKKPPRQPTGVVPLVRLVGLVAIAIVIVVVLVSWIGACQGQSKQAEYASYMKKVSTLAGNDRRLGKEFSNKLIARDAEAVPAPDGARAVRAAGAAGLRPGAADPPARPAPRHAPEPRQLDRAASEGAGRSRQRLLEPGGDEGRDDRRPGAHHAGGAPDRERRGLGPALPPAGDTAAQVGRGHRRRRAAVALRLESGSRQRESVHDRLQAACTAAPRRAARRAASTATRSSRRGRRRRESTSRPRRRRR